MPYKNKEDRIKWHKNYRDTTEYRRDQAISKRKKIAAMKLEVFTHYGNKCAHCGFSDIRALQMDHIDGNGMKDRKENGMGCSHMRYSKVLKDRTLLEKFQLLCANCNWIKRAENKEHKALKYT